MKQNFDVKGGPQIGRENLPKLRAEMQRQGLDGFYVPHEDEYQNEYLPEANERLAWVSGFTGSFGSAMILMDRAVLFADGRYTIQAADQTDNDLFERVHVPDPGPFGWLGAQDLQGKVLGYDAALMPPNDVATFDAAAGEWTVTVDRDGETVTLRPRQLVFATGMSGKANIPDFPGMDTFKGDQHHSSQHPGPDKYKGKKALVIGSNNSAHDICAALWENDVDVTMVQRSSTHIVRSEPLMEYGLGDLYSERAVEAGVTTQKADLIFASLPYRILHEFQIPVYDKIKEVDAEFYAGLEKAGFQLDWGADNSGLFMKYLRRGSGYYIDVGASQLLIDGKIKLKAGQVTEVVEDGVILDDGTRLEADLIVYATGYGSMNGWVADLIDQETADKVGKVWGLGSDTHKDPGPWEGEQRNLWQPTQQEALWFHGGNLHQSRHYSQFLSLQIKARMEGIDTPVYGLQEVHHRS